MKKNVLLLTLVTLVILCGNSYGQKITIGAKGGFSLPNLTGGSADNPRSTGYSSRKGADGGIYGEYHVNKKFSVSLGMEYSSQGGIKNGFQAYPTPAQMAPMFAPGPAPVNLYATFNSEAKMNYLLVPLLARYTWKLSKKSPMRIYAAAGPFAGFLLNAKQITSGNSNISMMLPDKSFRILTPQPVSFDASTNIKPDLYSFNAGLSGFVGLSYNLTSKHAIFVEAGGNYGFMTIQRDKLNGDNKTGAAVVTIGYAYTLQSKYNQNGGRR